MNELARGDDSIVVGAGVPLLERGKVNTHWLVERWDEDQTRWAFARMTRLNHRRPLR